MNLKYVLAVLCFVGCFLVGDASANGGLAVQRIRQPFFRPRTTVIRQQAIVQHHRVVAPLVVAPSVQRFVVPQTYVVPQAFVAPQIIAPQVVAPVFAAPACSSSAFFSLGY